ncbi:GH22200 [Drosophila grimshawi]|uniref:GH22200 n=1 Tax=Drosophila grimshawi TaxID=7222 RepID=B4K1D8_DROGR|nr:GH22200 [Drosophila grimshawi]
MTSEALESIDGEKHAKLNNEWKVDDKDVPDEKPQSANPTAGAEGAAAAAEPMKVDDAELVEATKQEPAKPSPQAFGWLFISPRSPHFCGLWDAAVNTAWHHHYRCVDQSVLVFDEWRALVCQTAAIINSCPLVPIAENFGDLDVVTPATILEPHLTWMDCNPFDDLQRVTHVHNFFGFRWREEGLAVLQHHARWRSPTQSLQVDDLVLDKNENPLPMGWLQRSLSR